MFDKITESRFQHLAGDFVKTRDKLNTLHNKLTETPGDVKRLRARVEELVGANVKYGVDNRRIMNNLIEVIRAIAKPADLNKVIAIGDDDTEISIEDILDAKGMIPECEPEAVDAKGEEREEEGTQQDRYEGELTARAEPELEFPSTRMRWTTEEGEPTRAEPSNGETQSDSSTSQIY